MEILPQDIRTYPVDLAAGGGSTEIKSGVSGQRWCVISASLATGAAASSVVVLSGATALTGTIPIPANTIWDRDGIVWISATAGEALNIDPGAGDVDGYVNVVMLK